jgi:hypothetical protein
MNATRFASAPRAGYAGRQAAGSRECSKEPGMKREQNTEKQAAIKASGVAA